MLLRDYLASAATLLGLFGGAAGALGINCRGSLKCHEMWNEFGAGKNLQRYFTANLEIIAENEPGRKFREGEHITCAGWSQTAICMFLQGNWDPVDIDTIRVMYSQLRAHGCRTCGSVPLHYPINNQVRFGQLTVNYVRLKGKCVDPNTGVKGSCGPRNYDYDPGAEYDKPGSNLLTQEGDEEQPGASAAVQKP